MKPVSWPLIGSIALIAVAVGIVLSWGLVLAGYFPLVFTPWLGALFVVIAAGLFWAGLGVRRLKAGKRTSISSLQAARIAAFARSVLINGSGFSGFFIGVGVASLFRIWAPSMTSSLIGAGIAALGSIIMTVVAALVEHWCIDDSADQGKAGAG